MLKYSIVPFVVSMFLVAGFATSCTSTDEKNMNQISVVTLTGQVQRVNLKDTTSTGDEHATEYLFISDDILDDPAYLQSTTLTLDRFIDKRVRLEGTWNASSPKIFKVESGEILEGETTTTTTGTKSFSSTSLGVFFTHPAAWEVTEEENATIEVRETKQEELLVKLFRVSAGRGESFDAWVDRNYPDSTPEEYQVGLLIGKKVTKDNQEILLVNDNTSFYTIVFYTGVQGLDALELSRGFGTIQSSLRFFTPGEEQAEDSSNNSSTSSENQDDVPASSTNATEEQDQASGETAIGTEAQPIVQYLLENSESLIGAGAKITQVEVAGSTNVYVTYTVNAEKKKVLLEYSPSGEAYTVQTVASFEPGTSTTWVKTAGSNSAANASREVYKVSESGDAEKTAVVEQGKSLYTNNQIDFQVQYPKNWYYSGESMRNEGGLQKVTFSNKPLDENPDQQVEVKVYAKNGFDLSRAQNVNIGDKKGFLVQDANGREQLAVQGNDGRVYVSNASEEQQKVAEEILKTLVTP